MLPNQSDVGFELNGASFRWDVTKAATNLLKHGVPFEAAAEVFFDPFLRLVDAARGDEARDAVIGHDKAGRLLFVVHVLIEDVCIRIISARKATRTEREFHDS